jgi:uncharacterized membrane protein
MGLARGRSDGSTTEALMAPTRNDSPGASPEPPLPFVAPCRELAVSAPLRWLVLGWTDLRRAPWPSLVYGVALTALSYAIALSAWWYGALALYLGLATGFVFVGPALAIGLYSISRQLEAGRTPRLGYCVGEGSQRLRDSLLLGVVLLVVLLVWARAASMVHVFFPVRGEPTWQDLVPFLTIGSVVGALFAAVVFAASAFSLPMLLDRKADPITAVVTSVNAVLRNKAPMLVWGGLIGASLLLGFATAFLGFLILMPVIGHATWHAYRETIDASAWPPNGPLDR